MTIAQMAGKERNKSCKLK